MSAERKQLIENNIEENSIMACYWIDQLAFNIRYGLTTEYVEQGIKDSLEWAIEWVWKLWD